MWIYIPCKIRFATILLREVGVNHMTCNLDQIRNRIQRRYNFKLSGTQCVPKSSHDPYMQTFAISFLFVLLDRTAVFPLTNCYAGS